MSARWEALFLRSKLGRDHGGPGSPHRGTWIVEPLVEQVHREGRGGHTLREPQRSSPSRRLARATGAKEPLQPALSVGELGETPVELVGVGTGVDEVSVLFPHSNFRRMTPPTVRFAADRN